ncbi:MAG: hypothetical protein UT55_C0004G0010 [Candidatus Peregrinibacteria bacterium GW2011_GWE2_39_6]|nr:MAG: hypothetical protein UT36_C0004G0077 [Candidatus Peregrinibacteria bacterium GW2011_GWF2_39_17]KKR26646.1 MAG: hypothetical protein UT55_C0004G0010 [Candidatus Peregrinibacteria bacterium GW2011_GWE2_39_6]HCW32235.1 hypothetical protein [Candidatus Peregrinibacteria bacterium]
MENPSTVMGTGDPVMDVPRVNYKDHCQYQPVHFRDGSACIQEFSVPNSLRAGSASEFLYHVAISKGSVGPSFSLPTDLVGVTEARAMGVLNKIRPEDQYSDLLEWAKKG